MNKKRLNKYLSECGIASRRKSEEYIEQGRVQVNGKVVTQLGIQVDPVNDVITVDGENIAAEKKVYYLLNKPQGYVTTTSDEKHRKTVVELIKTRQTIFPVGRLDYNTTGVLLLTNDGDFANLLTHPKNKVPRVYTANLDKPLEEKNKIRLLTGIKLDGRNSKFQTLIFSKKENFKVVTVSTVEGRNHFVKRMFESVGCFVRKLRRDEFAGFNVKGMVPGAYMELNKNEIDKIINEYSKNLG